MRDLHSNVKVAKSLTAANRTADANGTGVDLAGFESAEVVVSVGASGDTLSGSVYIAYELEESDDNSNWTDVAAADILGGNGGANGQFALVDDPAEDDTVYRVGYIGTKRYIRVVANVTGTHTNGCPSSAVVVLGHARHAPVADQTI